MGMTMFRQKSFGVSFNVTFRVFAKILSGFSVVIDKALRQEKSESRKVAKATNESSRFRIFLA
jgi:hypothetical protein